jgi:hypothetical protein
MLATQRRDRLFGATFLGAIWTVLSTAVVCGLNPIGGTLHDFGTPAQATVILLVGLFWVGLFYGMLTWWSRKSR